MTITAWAIHRWQQTVVNGVTTNTPDFGGATYASWEDIAGTPNANIPPNVNLCAGKFTNLPDKATLDALDAATGVIVLAAINDDDTRVTGYLRPQDSPTGPQLAAARTRLQNAGIPTAFLTANITAGMTLAQIADVLRAWARDLIKG